jgi:hypothetical protein
MGGMVMAPAHASGRMGGCETTPHDHISGGEPTQQTPLPASQPRATATHVGAARRGYVSRDAEVAACVSGVVATFAECVAAYDRRVPFILVGQYDTHRAAIDRRRRSATVNTALDDEEFLGLLYVTLRRWGIGVRASWLVPLAEFRRQLRAQADALCGLDGARIDDQALDVLATADQVWSIITRLEIVSNISVIVPGTKAMHHLLPDLVPPMDRAWTGAFFLWSAAAPQYAQAATFSRTFASFAEIAQAVRPAQFIGAPSEPKCSITLSSAIARSISSVRCGLRSATEVFRWCPANGPRRTRARTGAPPRAMPASPAPSSAISPAHGRLAVKRCRSVTDWTLPCGGALGAVGGS